MFRVPIRAAFGVDQLKRSLLLSLSFWTWLGLLSFPMILVYRDTTGIDEDARGMLAYQLVGWVQFTIAALLLYPRGFLQVWKRMNYVQLSIITVFYLSTILQFQGDGAATAVGLVYTITFLCTALMVPLIWTLPAEAIHRLTGGSAIVLVVFQVSSIAVLGWPQDRFVGGIHPNLLGAVILSAFILAQFNTGKLMTLLKITSFAFAAAISSRYSLVGCLIAALVFRVTFYKLGLRTISLLIVSACVLVILAQQYSDVLMISDADRGIGSGISGRDSLWTSAFDLIANNPLGAGYKRGDPFLSGHNGFLRLIVEFGVIGGGILIGAVLLLVSQAVVNAYFLSGVPPLLRRFASARAAGLSAFAFAAFFQPQLFNLGDAMGISIILILFGPDTNLRFWARINARIAMSGWIGAYASRRPKSLSSLQTSPRDRAGI